MRIHVRLAHAAGSDAKRDFVYVCSSVCNVDHPLAARSMFEQTAFLATVRGVINAWPAMHLRLVGDLLAVWPPREMHLRVFEVWSFSLAEICLLV